MSDNLETKESLGRDKSCTASSIEPLSNECLQLIVPHKKFSLMGFVVNAMLHAAMSQLYWIAKGNRVFRKGTCSLRLMWTAVCKQLSTIHDRWQQQQWWWNWHDHTGQNELSELRHRRLPRAGTQLRFNDFHCQQGSCS